MSHRTSALRRPYAFWLPVAFVLVVGSFLSFRNYFHRQLPATQAADASGGVVLIGVEDVDTAPVNTASYDDVTVSDDGPRMQRLLVSLAMVMVMSVVAGFSISQLLRRPAIGFHTLAEAEKSLRLPILGVVPLTTPSPAH
jgi:hypothetical protein